MWTLWTMFKWKMWTMLLESHCRININFALIWTISINYDLFLVNNVIVVETVIDVLIDKLACKRKSEKLKLVKRHGHDKMLSRQWCRDIVITYQITYLNNIPKCTKNLNYINLHHEIYRQVLEGTYRYIEKRCKRKYLKYKFPVSFLQ